MLNFLSQSRLVSSCLVAVISVSGAQAQQSQAEACFDAKDQACLEELFSDIVLDKTPDKLRAIYLLGRLQEDAGNFAEAENSYMMSLGFGGGEEPQQALENLFATQPQVFTEPSSCLQIESETCFSAIIDNGAAEDVANAQYLLGGLLISADNENGDPARAVGFLEAASDGGNETAPCLLYDAYQAGLPGLEPNYDKLIRSGLQCSFADPIPNLNEDHFAKYEAQKGHKAYALGETGWSSYSEGVVDPEIAARLALEFCNTSKHRKSGTADCRLINVDGVWVDDPETQPIPDFSGDIGGLILQSAQDAFQDDFSDRSDLRVFVQSRSGSWNWQAAGRSSTTIEELTDKALSGCNSGWQSRLGYPCEVVNLNGDWVK